MQSLKVRVIWSPSAADRLHAYSTCFVVTHAMRHTCEWQQILHLRARGARIHSPHLLPQQVRLHIDELLRRAGRGRRGRRRGAVAPGALLDPVAISQLAARDAPQLLQRHAPPQVPLQVLQPWV